MLDKIKKYVYISIGSSVGVYLELSVKDSINNSVSTSVRDSIGNSVWYLIGVPIDDSIKNNLKIIDKQVLSFFKN